MIIKIKLILILAISLLITFFPHRVNEKNEKYYVLSKRTWETRIRPIKKINYDININYDEEKEAETVLKQLNSFDALETYLINNNAEMEIFSANIPDDLVTNDKIYGFIADNFMNWKLDSMNLSSTIDNVKYNDKDDEFGASYDLSHPPMQHWFYLTIYKNKKFILWERCKCL